jgi:hypothetical protein
LLHAELQHSRNPVLSGSVAQATHDLTAHAAQLGERASHLLQARPQEGIGEQIEHWLVRLETMLIRIDAAFARNHAAASGRAPQGNRSRSGKGCRTP